MSDGFKIALVNFFSNNFVWILGIIIAIVLWKKLKRANGLLGYFMSNGHVVSYEEAIRYFVNHRPKDPRVVKGALLREKSGDRHMLVSVFLDKNNETVSDKKGNPYGRKIRARGFDEELERAFGDKDMIVVE